MSEYNIKINKVTARMRSEKLRQLGINGCSTNNVIYNTPDNVVEGHTHTNKAYLDALIFDSDNYLYIQQVKDDDEGVDKVKVKAGYADEAGTLSKDSPIVKKIDSKLSKIEDDTAAGKITFEKGIQLGKDYVPGITGVGGHIDDKGAAELDSLSLRKFLEVPELRYNRVEVSMGDKWSAPGAGIIADVDSVNKIITLKLEEGEIGCVAVGDICMGIYHSTISSDNASADSDDSRGNRKFAGFATVYFTVTEIIENGDNSKFKYELRPISERWSYEIEPFPAMHFVAYGNFINSERQTSRYETRTYQRYLFHVDNWEFESKNIAAQFGDLANLSVHGLNMSGYSAFLNNIYMTGTVQQTSSGDSDIEYAVNRGLWTAAPDSPYMDGDAVWHNSAYYVSTLDNNTEEPSENAENWFFCFKEGKDGKGYECFYKLTKGETPTIPDGTQDSTPPEGWNATPLSPTLEYPTCYMVYHVRENGEWSAFRVPTLFSRYAKDGEPGKDGKPGEPGKDGNPGKDGLTGCAVRITEWVEGVYYRNDNNISVEQRIDGIGYIDIVIIQGSTMRIFSAKEAHNGIAATINNHPTSAVGSTYWQEFNKMMPIYTPLILAEYAVLKFSQHNQMLVCDENGNIVAGLVGGNKTFWIGGDTYDSPKTKFKVSKEGKLVAVDATLEGEITAKKGQLGGFEIGDGRIGNVATINDGIDNNGEYSMSLYRRFIKFAYDNIVVMFGANVAAAEVGIPLLGKLINSTPNSLGKNYGCYIKVNNADYNIALFGEGNIGFNGNIQGYKYVDITPPKSTVTILSYKSSTVIVKLINDASGIGLPSRLEVAGQLVIPTEIPTGGTIKDICFSVSLKIIISADSTKKGYVYGRNTSITGMGNEKYPWLIDPDGNVITSGLAREAGDSYTFELVYDGTNYRAYITSQSN
jgi:hypothetical protein